MKAPTSVPRAIDKPAPPRPLPYSKFGMVTFVLALGFAVLILFEIGRAHYLARGLPSGIWGNGNFQLSGSTSHDREKDIGDFFILRYETLPRLVPAGAVVFLLGAISMCMPKTRRYFGQLTMLVSAAAISSLILFYICNFSM